MANESVDSIVTKSNGHRTHKIPRIQVFHPTLEEMKDFSGYLKSMEAKGAHKAGLAKIIPPSQWKPRKDMNYECKEIDEFVIKAPIEQKVTGRQGIYQQYNFTKRSMTVAQFRNLAKSPRYATPEFFDYDELERRYWKNVTYNPGIYGADVSGSLYDEDVEEFNINKLNTILDMVNESYGIKIEGVNTAYLYFGMWKTTFPWHTEDMDLYSINYLHYGMPKSWYVVPPEHGRRLERLAAGFFPQQANCPAFLRHKMTLISPAVLKEYAIPYSKITQEAGEFMITFPYSYHAGYNHGYNCAESTNFALERWVEYGKRATRCNCRPDSVKISMEAFIKKYQPDRYDLWLQGKDFGPHPEDPTHISAAPLPTDYELQVLSKVNSKSKRHPAVASDVESENDLMCESNQQSSLFPTKAARKHFEIAQGGTSLLLPSHLSLQTSNDCKDSESNNYLKPSLPDLKDAVRRIKNRASNSHKKSKKVASMKAIQDRDNFVAERPRVILNHPDDYSKSNPSLCTTQARPMIPLTWIPSSVADHNALNMINCFLNYAPQQNPLSSPWPAASSSLLPSHLSPFSSPSDGHNPETTYTLDDNCSRDVKNISNQTVIFPCQPSTSACVYSPKEAPSSSSNSFAVNTSEYSCSGSQYVSLFAPPNSDAQVFQKPILNSSNNISEAEYEMQRDSNYLLDADLQQCVELTSPPSFIEAGTSNEIEVNTDFSKSINSDDLMDLFYPDNTEIDFKSMLYKIPIKTLLYQHMPYSFFAEELFNASLSTIYPHCAVCVLMTKYHLRPDWVDAFEKIPTVTPVLIPEGTFRFDQNQLEISIDEKFDSPIVICSKCHISVHTSCYGVTPIPKLRKRTNWLCDRCKSGDIDASCLLCPLRGGALKRTKKNNWIHLTCAAVHGAVYFDNYSTKSPADISKIAGENEDTPLIVNLQAKMCIYCKELLPNVESYTSGYEVQCYFPFICSNFFHVTCALLHGGKCFHGDWPNPCSILCSSCVNKDLTYGNSDDDNVINDIEVGSTVVAKRGIRYYECTVVECKEVRQHKAHLEDNSYARGLRDQDIISPNIEENGIPEVGDPIVVRQRRVGSRIDEGGRYAGNYKSYSYIVKFEDESTKIYERKDIYRMDEPLPLKIKKKLSMATEVIYEPVYWTNEPEKASNRMKRRQRNGSDVKIKVEL